ncbi:13559_t:CDS:2 [Ambispora gerdemannii]|uniref:13559_t:CDS:1 n=1 Tax=Ambispora gerdemannii TaxID=144530 RepID=A0A9N9FKP7_9GLOM|nr:13559_t:CDS:2 [Ambispora gerdemannii]
MDKQTVRGGQEEKVIQTIKSELAKKSEWENYVRDLQVVSDTNKKKLLKGYVLCSCHLTTGLVRFLYGILGVIGFLNYKRGSERDNKLPDFVSAEAINSLFAKLQEKKENKAVVKNNGSELKVGDLVRVISGIFSNYEGKITYLDNKKQQVKIIIETSGWEITEVPINSCQKVLN